MKMADVDIDPFGEHDKTNAQPDETGQKFSVTPGGAVERKSSSEPERKQKTSFKGGKTQSTRLKESFVEELYQELSEDTGPTPEAFHFDDSELRDGKLY